MREVEEQPSTNLTRFGRDPEEFGRDNYLQAEEVPELVQPVINKLFEIYSSYGELYKLIQNLKNGAYTKAQELKLRDIDDDFYDDIDTVESLSKETISKIEDIMGDCFAEYINDPYEDCSFPRFNRSDDRFGKAGIEYHSKTV